MFEHLFHLLSENLQNQFLSGGIILMLAGSAIALCRKVPFQIWRWIERRLTITVDISSDDPLFFICALAGHFRMNLYILNLASSHMSDDNLMALLARVPLRSIVLLEDIDAAFAQRQKSDGVGNKLTFSGLLNALDGAGSKDGTMLFMTTNHIDRLDEALIRPGRADMHLRFLHARAEQCAAMFTAFFPDLAADAESAVIFGRIATQRRMTMAEVQQHLILYQHSPNEALGNLDLIDARAS